jgi:hypothetical protein
MNITGISSGLLQQIAGSSTQTGDAVTVTVMRKAMDIQAQQAAQLIDSVQQVGPAAGAGPGQSVDVRV